MKSEVIKSTKTGSFADVAIEWLSWERCVCKESSYIRYEDAMYRYLLPRFGDEKIEQIARKDVLDFCQSLVKGENDYNGGGLAAGTVAGLTSILRNVFRYARDIMEYNVADIGYIPLARKRTKEIRAFSLEEQKALEAYLKNDLNPSNLGILLCLYTGLRVGEICALRWDDVLFEEKCIYVHNAVQRLPNARGQGRGEKKTRLVLSKPKSAQSVRKIPVPSKLQNILVNKWEEGAFILSGSTKITEPRTMQYRFASILRTCGLENASFHCLRHTFATRCIEMGMDVKCLSELLGHSNVAITLGTYVHPSMDIKQQQMERLSDLFIQK